MKLPDGEEISVKLKELVVSVPFKSSKWKGRAFVKFSFVMVADDAEILVRRRSRR